LCAETYNTGVLASKQRFSSRERRVGQYDTFPQSGDFLSPDEGKIT